MHYLSYHCSITKCVKEPHNSSRRQSPWSYAGLICRWWNSQIPWQWWITLHVTHSDAKRSVKATDMENEGLFKLHEEKFGLFHCFLSILIIQVFKWNCRDAKPSQWLGWFISTLAMVLVWWLLSRPSLGWGPWALLFRHHLHGSAGTSHPNKGCVTYGIFFFHLYSNNSANLSLFLSELKCWPDVINLWLSQSLVEWETG